MEQNFNLYHIFYTVARCGNISSAANSLYISQPAISKSISKLEQNLNTTLFLRSSRGVTLTMEGEMLFRQVETAFHAIENGEAQLKRVGELGVGTISIGVSTTLCRFVLLPYLKQFVADHPHVKLSISCQPTGTTVQALRDGKVDIGLIGEPSRYLDLAFVPNREIQDIFVTTKTYLDNLKKRMAISGKSVTQDTIFSQATLILMDQNNVSRQYVDKYIGKDLVEPGRLLEVSTMDLLIDFVKIDLGIACVISDFVRSELECGELIRIKSPTVIPKRKIGFSYRNGADEQPLIKDFLSYVK